VSTPEPPRIPEAPAGEPVVRPEHVAEAERIAALLRLLGPLRASARELMGVTLFTAVGPRVDEDAVIRSAFRFLSFLAASPEPVEQLTLRGAGGIAVLTPLGLPETGGPVLVAALPSRGGLAVLESLSRRAAAAYRAAHPSPGGDRVHRPPPASTDLTLVPVPLQMVALARGLAGLGPVSPMVLEDATAEMRLCLMLGPGSDARGLARLARDLYQVVGVTGDLGGVGPVQSIALRLGGRRVHIRALQGPTTRCTLLVASGGGEDRPGLARREVERVAARLGSAS
jgi:hypothetical protein